MTNKAVDLTNLEIYEVVKFWEDYLPPFESFIVSETDREIRLISEQFVIDYYKDWNRCGFGYPCIGYDYLNDDPNIRYSAMIGFINGEWQHL